MSEPTRDLRLNELLCRADLMETELKIARFMVLDWLFGNHTPTKEELKELGGVLIRHDALTADVKDMPPTDGEDFKLAQAALVKEYDRKLQRR